MGIEVARKARAEQSLDKRVRLDSGEVLTRRQLMDRCLSQGGKLRTIRERKHAAEEKLAREVERRSRTYPMGNPNHPETREFYALRDKLKEGLYDDVVYVELPSGTLYSLSKAEVDYFKSRGGT